MKKGQFLNRTGKTLQTSQTRFCGDVSRQIGNIRAVTLEGMRLNSNEIFGASRAVQESIKDAYGTQHDAQLTADRRAYEITDTIVGTLDTKKKVE